MTQTATPPSTPDTPLDEYIARAEPKYQWEKIEERSSPQNTLTVLKLTSQTWQDRDWTHRVEIIAPTKIEISETALVLVSFGSQPESLVAQLLANSIGAPVVNITGVPNQPLWNMREDALIAHSFKKFLETGDTTWPLLLPMTKSVIATLDAVQEYSAQQQKPLKKFIVAGASKRGWTSYLTAAADAKRNPNRIIGIIPIVYNNLNIPQQLPHQLESWGEYSEMIGDYTRLGLQDETGSKRGQQLVAMVDPYFYRDRLTMPKLLINGANDRYWTPDATRFYLKDLPGQTSLYFAPNAGHDLGSDYPNVLSTTAAWFRVVASGQDTPRAEMHAAIRSDSFRDVIARVSPGAQSVQLWVAHSKTADFRNATWKAMPMKNSGSYDKMLDYRATIPATSADLPFVAVFAQASYKTGAALLKISSAISIWNGLKPIALKEQSNKICPFCDSTSAVIPISYGLILLTDDIRRKEAWGEFFGGGCVIGNKKWHCRRCDREF